VRLVLGPAFQDSVPVLRIFALWIPLVALCTVITFQLLLPNELDNRFNIANFTAALVGIGAALLLAPGFGAIGIAWSAVIVQTYTLLAFSVILWRTGLNPFALSTTSVYSRRSTGWVPMPAVAGAASKGAGVSEELTAASFAGRQRIS
jgi:O-antigen/teichoic acid export membrane protein